MKEIGITDDEQKMIDEMSGLSNTLVPLEENAMENVANGKKSLAVEYVYGEDYNDAVKKIKERKNGFLEMLDERAAGEVKWLVEVLNFINFWVIFSVFLVAALQIYTYLFTKKRIIGPVLSIREQMEQISEGNLSAEFSLEADSSERGSRGGESRRCREGLCRCGGRGEKSGGQEFRSRPGHNGADRKCAELDQAGH